MSHAGPSGEHMSGGTIFRRLVVVFSCALVPFLSGRFSVSEISTIGQCTVPQNVNRVATETQNADTTLLIKICIVQ